VNAYLASCIHPRQVVREVVDLDPTYRVLRLALLAGAAGLSMQMLGSSTTIEVPLPLFWLVGIALVAGVVFGVIGALIELYLFGWLFGVAGRWLGGQANACEIRAAIAWSKVPILIASLVWLVFFILSLLILSGRPDVLGIVSFFVNALGYLFVAITSIWSFFLLCHMLGEVHHFSAWRAWGAMALANLLIASVVFVFILVLAIVIPNVFRATSNVSARAGQRALQRVQTVHVPTQLQTMKKAKATNVNLQVESGNILLKDGTTLEGKIMYEDSETIYVETPDGIVNVEKVKVQEVIRGRDIDAEASTVPSDIDEDVMLLRKTSE